MSTMESGLGFFVFLGDNDGWEQASGHFQIQILMSIFFFLISGA